jgi:predicted ATPase
MGAIPMKNAQVADSWRRLRAENRYRPVVSSIRVQSLKGFKDDELRFDTPIAVICGGNGVGKTHLLQAIWLAIDPAAASAANSVSHRIGGATINIGVILEGNEARSEIALTEAGNTSAGQPPVCSIARMDPGLARLAQDYFEKEADIGGLLEGLPEHRLESNETDIINYIVGKNYTEVTFVDVELSDDIVYPFCRVTENGQSYDIRTMGLGELAAMCVYWLVRRTPARSIILLEEPESFLNPRSQAHLIDFIVSHAAEKNCSCIISTHSPNVVKKFNNEELYFIIKLTAEGAIIGNKINNVYFKKQIGLNIGIPVVLLVEDQVALDACISWVSTSADLRERDIEICIVAGTSELDSFVHAWPGHSKTVCVVALYDGDQRPRLEQMRRDRPDRWARPTYACLPGGVSMEALLRTFTRREGQSAAEALKLSVEQFAAIQGNIEGMDEHDWLSHLAGRVGRPKANVIHELLQAWLATPAGQEASASALLELVSAINQQTT